MLIKRPFWENLIEKAWEQKNIIWLMGIRRVGKTSLCKNIPNIEYFDCEKQSVRYLFENSEVFLSNQKGKRIVIDEIHKLDNPSEILKLAADYYPETKIIATGSSTLGASAKFKDTLTGRKKEIWLTPLLLQEIENFGNSNIQHRFLYGGLPFYFSSTIYPEENFKEWIDAYWAKDIQEMFQVGKRYSFQKFAELLLAHSGGQFEASKFAAPCEISRQTISNYLAILEATFIVHVIRPYSTYKPNEIIMAPKIYGFDTGFVCYSKGWRDLRREDLGLLWEHIVLNEIQTKLQIRSINYWRDKQGHEIDFIILNKKDRSISTIECKYSSTSLDLAAIFTNIEAFRKHYPEGKNYIVTNDVDISFEKHYNNRIFNFININKLTEELI